MLRRLQHRAGAEAGAGDHRAGGVLHGTLFSLVVRVWEGAVKLGSSPVHHGGHMKTPTFTGLCRELRTSQT